MKLKPIETAPKDGRYILVAGPSGYATTPLRYAACRYDAEYRPLSPWVNHSNDSFEDGGEGPTHWCELPEIESIQGIRSGKRKLQYPDLNKGKPCIHGHFWKCKICRWEWGYPDLVWLQGGLLEE